MQKARSTASLAVVVIMCLCAFNPSHGDECVSMKRDRHLTIMEEYRHSPNWNGFLTEDTLNLHNNQTEVDLSRQGFREVHWHFSGVAEDDGYNIYDLNLAYNNLEELNELTFLKFQSLDTLNLSYNRIQAIGNLTFGSLIRLIELDLSFNLLHTIEVQAFDRLYALEVLVLRENCLVTLAPHQFYFNDHMSSLLLDHNQLAFLPSSLFDTIMMVDEIYELDLSNNNFRRMPFIETKEISLLKIDHNHIEALTVNGTYNVRALQIQHNNIYDADLFRFARAEHIDLSHNNLDNIVGLHEMKQLEYLDLSSNNVSRFDYNLKYSIRNIPSLVTLRLQNCSLHDGNVRGLLASDSILNLDLSQNSFVRLNVSELARLRTLQYLSLNFNYLLELVNYDRIGQDLPYLETVSLSFNRWNCTYFDQLNAFLNRTHIHSTSHPRDCYINGTHVTDSHVTDEFEPQYTMEHVKRDMNSLRMLSHSAIRFMYLLFSTWRETSNETATYHRHESRQMADLERDVDRLTAMLAFLVAVFAGVLLVAVVYGAFRLVRRWQHDRAVKVVTYSKRSNEFSNGVTVSEVIRENSVA